MRQICVLQWEEIKTKNSGENVNYVGGGIIRYIAIVDKNNDYKTQEYLFKPWEEGFKHQEERLYLRRMVLNVKRKLNLGNKDKCESSYLASRPL